MGTAAAARRGASMMPRERASFTLARTIYAGVNHKHLSELLAERDAITLSHPTVHRILREVGLRSPRRRRPPRHRRRRDRMPRVGMLQRG